MGNIDQNYERAAYAVTDDANKTPSPLLIDPSTGRLMIAIIRVDSLPDTSNPQTKIDENNENVAMASDGTNPRPLLCDADGNLIIDIVCET